MTIMKIEGISSVAAQNKITVIAAVAKLLNIKQGDEIAFLKNSSGDIIIKKLSDIEMKDSEVES